MSIKKIGYVLAVMLLVLCLCAILTACDGGEDAPVDGETPVLRDLCWAAGAVLPTAEDFAVSLPQGASIRFSEDYRFSALGEYDISLTVTDESGREQIYGVQLRLIQDTEPPVITGVKDLSAYLGDGIAYRNGVQTTDNCDGPVTLTVDTSSVDLMLEGVYEVVYTATDAAGNSASVRVSLYLYREAVTLEQLYAMLDPIIAARIPTAGTVEMQVREVYVYVYNNIQYDAHSDKNDWVRAAYEGLRTGKGDCYTYFALSKAFFERLGIENLEIERTPGLVDERHYWNLVNIGSSASPRWYHFDATQLRGAQHIGCLLTDAQVRAYTKLREDGEGNRNYFYAYDATEYPASDPTVITPTPDLEPYY